MSRKTLLAALLWLVGTGFVVLADDPAPAPEHVGKPPRAAQRTDSGLAYIVLREGSTPYRPDSDDTVEILFTGWTADGTVINSSTNPRKPAQVQVDQVIEGWSESLVAMAEGERRRIWVPQELAFKGMTGTPVGVLTYDLELIAIVRPPTEAPRDVAAAPDDAERSESGLAWKVLQKGWGDRHPAPDSRVTMRYSAWKTDGTLLDSSYNKSKRPQAFRLPSLIAGVREGIALMSKGERRRFWIPAELAYEGEDDRRRGALVFEIELVSFD